MAGRKTPPNAGIGRKKGNPNKITRAAKEAFALAFEGIGGVDGFVKWAKTHRTEFYRLYSRLLQPEPNTALLTVNASLVGIVAGEPITDALRAAEVYQQIMRGGADLDLEQIRFESPVAVQHIAPGPSAIEPDITDTASTAKDSP